MKCRRQLYWAKKLILHISKKNGMPLVPEKIDFIKNSHKNNAEVLARYEFDEKLCQSTLRIRMKSHDGEKIVKIQKELILEDICKSLVTVNVEKAKIEISYEKVYQDAINYFKRENNLEGETNANEREIEAISCS